MNRCRRIGGARPEEMPTAALRSAVAILEDAAADADGVAPTTARSLREAANECRRELRLRRDDEAETVH